MRDGDYILIHEAECVDYDLKGNRLTYWTEWKRVVGGKVFNKGTCCCSRPLATRRTCADSRSLKTPCRCACHRVPPKKGIVERNP